MNSEIKSIVNSDLYNSFLEIAKDDIVLQSVLKKTDSLEQFINALIASIICITDRETHFQGLVKNLLETNPQVQEILKIKHDPSLLPQGENPKSE